MKSDKSFRDFVKESKSILIIGVLIFCGLLFILIGSFEKQEKSLDEEDRLAEMCSMIDGVGECRVMITYEDESRVSAVLILCSGAESVVVRSNLTEAVCALYGIGSNRVEIFSLNEEYADK